MQTTKSKLPKPNVGAKPTTISTRFGARLLRRKSKSVTDLRTAAAQPNLMLNLDKPLLTRKRPAVDKLKADEKKPAKVQKVKIPDWDYKSRFYELQKKHDITLTELKQYKTQVADLPDIQKNLELYTVQNAELIARNKILQNTNSQFEEKIENFETSSNTMQKYLLDKENNIKELRREVDLLRTENESHKQLLENERIELRQTLCALDELRNKSSGLEKNLLTVQTELEEQENLRRNLHNCIQDLKGNIRVFCRVRPPVGVTEHDRLLCNFNFPNECSIEVRKSRESVCSMTGKFQDIKQEFNFDKVFQPESCQADVFEDLAQLVQSAVDGYHVCVFAYGQTGSGKTFTMQGSMNDQGMIPRSIKLLFEKMHKLSLSQWKYSVSVSFLEIYNENLKDLLEPNNCSSLEIRFNEGRGVSVTNLKIVDVETASELQEIMIKALKNRAVASTEYNEESSRSHAITRINVTGENSLNGTVLSGSINLVDLAGSESAKTTLSERLTETKHINKSLSTLGSVMLALHNKSSHVPFRNSKLTFLLQNCLAGNSKTLMIVNVSPFEECFNETINSLRFASKVKEIKTQAKKNKMFNNGLMTIPPSN